MRTLPNDQVQHFLNQLEPNERFNVIFLKANGSQRQIKDATLKPSDSRKELVPVWSETEGKWSSFNVGKVLYIGAN